MQIYPPGFPADANAGTQTPGWNRLHEVFLTGKDWVFLIPLPPDLNPPALGLTAATMVLFARYLIKTSVPSLRAFPLPLVQGFLQQQDFPGCQVSQPCRLRSHLWVKVEKVTFHSWVSWDIWAGGKHRRVLGMCVCVCTSVFVLPDALLGPKYLWGLCVTVTVLHNVFNWVLPGFSHPRLMWDKLSYKYVSYLNEQMNSCMVFQAHVAASASEVSVVTEKLVFFAALLSSLPLKRPNKCNGHQMLHRNVIDDCVEEIPNFIFLCRKLYGSRESFSCFPSLNDKAERL